jgi:hypothetical protein
MTSDLEDLVGRLANLHETDRVALQILSAGRAAVPALVVTPLRAVFRRHRLLGAAEALAAVGDDGALDDVARALEDDFGRERFLDVLRRFGASAEIAVSRVLAECDSLPDTVLLRKRRVACRRFLAERRAPRDERP